MDIASVCPLPVASLIWQPRPSTWVFTFVSKATFALRPGESVLAPEQEAPNEQDDHWDDDPGRSVRAPSDLVPVKPRPEVMLVGHAFAPQGTPVRSVVARLVVGEVDKVAEVFVDRSFTMDGVLKEGPRFTRMPLVYERAAGGSGTVNPVGVQVEARDGYGRRAVPNVQPVGLHIAEPEDVVLITPVGFGPLAAGWPSRAEKLGPHAASFLAGRWHERPLPEGMDLGYFNQAPRDQQLSALRETERIALEHLHAEHARLVTNLPGLRPAAFADRARGAPQRLPLRADTLWIDTDRAIATLTWRGQLTLERPDEVGRVLVGMEMPGREVTWAEVAQAAGRSHRSSSGLHAIRLDDAPVSSSASPFAVAVDETQAPDGSSTMTADLSGPVAAAMPFAVPAGGGERRERSVQDLSAGLPFQRSPSTAGPAPARPATPVGAPASQPPPVVPPPMPPPQVMPPPVVPPPMAGAPRPVVESPWAAGAPSEGAAARPSIGMAMVMMAATPEEAPAVGRAPEPGGALTMSNAAAAASAPWSPPRRELEVVALEAEAEPRPGWEAPREMLQLLWFEPESVARIRRVAAWREVLDELERTPLDRELDDAGGSKEPWEVEDRREVFEVLARGAALDARGVGEAFAGAMRADGKLVPPLVLLAVEVELPFDELETLRATATTAAALITPTDEGLRAAVEAADRFLGRPGLAASPSVCEGLTARIREAFAREKKALPGDYLDAQVERVLLVGRHYQKREVFGGVVLRALLWLPGEQAGLIGYVPEDLGKKLPMYRRFRARLLGEVHPGQDQYEVQGEAVRVVAVGRVGGTLR